MVDMGLIRSVTRDGDTTRVQLILTTGWCPFAATLVTSIQERVRQAGVPGDVEVEVTWDEPWTTDRLSPDARRKLRFLPEPRTVTDLSPARLPYRNLGHGNRANAALASVKPTPAAAPEDAR